MQGLTNARLRAPFWKGKCRTESVIRCVNWVICDESPGQGAHLAQVPGPQGGHPISDLLRDLMPDPRGGPTEVHAHSNLGAPRPRLSVLNLRTYSSSMRPEAISGRYPRYAGRGLLLDLRRINNTVLDTTDRTSGIDRKEGKRLGIRRRDASRWISTPCLGVEHKRRESGTT